MILYAKYGEHQPLNRQSEAYAREGVDLAFHVIPRGHVGPSLLAMILYAKYGEHQPLNRQSEAYAREGVDLDVSTLADHVGTGAAVLSPLTELICRHVFAADRVHGDDTTVPVLAKGKTVTGRLWAYVRDDRPFAGPDPPAFTNCPADAVDGFERLAVRVQGLPLLAREASRSEDRLDRVDLVDLGDRREPDDLPFLLPDDMADEIVLVQPLHDDDNGAIALVVEPAVERMVVPFVGGLPLSVGQGFVGL